MIDRMKLAEAVRRLDSRISDGVPLDRILADLHIDPRGAMYSADERALRAVLAGDEELADLDPAILALLPVIAMVWLDGLAVGASVAGQNL